MRKALRLELPDPRIAQMHIEYQGQKFAEYRRSYMFERDCEGGIVKEIPPFERALS